MKKKKLKCLQLSFFENSYTLKKKIYINKNYSFFNYYFFNIPNRAVIEIYHWKIIQF